MGTQIDKGSDAWRKLIDEDLAWLLKQPRTLERDHIEVMLKAELPPLTCGERVVAKVVASLPPAALEAFGKFDQWALMKALDRCDLEDYPDPRGDLVNGVRASGAVVCPLCHKEYREHPLDWRMLGYNQRPYLNIVCSGHRVKL